MKVWLDFGAVSAVSVRPKEPYFEWAAQVADGVPVVREDWYSDANVYVLPRADNVEQAMAHLERGYRFIWRTELALWDEDESRWPPRPTFEGFLGWFAIEVHTSLFDLSGLPIWR